MFKSLAVITALAIFASASAADAPATAAPADNEKVMAQFRDDLQAASADIVAKGITLTGDQAAKFWPLFQEYQAELLPEYKARLEAAGVNVSPIVHHNDVGPGWTVDGIDKTNWCSSIYFHDPDGIQLEFAGWTRQFNDADIPHEPATEGDKARFRAEVVALDERDWGTAGTDLVRFLIATNPGQELGPLGRIASGGELSRLMLALKVVLSSGSPVPT